MRILLQFFSEKSGATSIEYGVIGAVVSVACIVGARAIGVSISAKWLGPLSAAFN